MREGSELVKMQAVDISYGSKKVRPPPSPPLLRPATEIVNNPLSGTTKHLLVNLPR
jgi:hypothetical protein